MARKTEFTTLAQQQRRANSSLDRGKKIAVGCLVGASFVFFNWSGSYAGFSQLMIACLAVAGAIAAQMRQVSLRPSARLMISVVLVVIGFYFGVTGILSAMAGLAS
jgi:hypothetical protein